MQQSWAWAPQGARVYLHINTFGVICLASSNAVAYIHHQYKCTCIQTPMYNGFEHHMYMPIYRDTKDIYTKSKNDYSE